MPSQPQRHQSDESSFMALLRDYLRIDEANRRFVEMEKRIEDNQQRMGEDMSEIKKDVKEIKDVRLVNLETALMTNQKAGLERIIKLQAFILSPIAIAVIAYLMKLIFRF